MLSTYHFVVHEQERSVCEDHNAELTSWRWWRDDTGSRRLLSARVYADLWPCWLKGEPCLSPIDPPAAGLTTVAFSTRVDTLVRIPLNLRCCPVRIALSFAHGLLPGLSIPSRLLGCSVCIALSFTNELAMLCFPCRLCANS